MYTGYSLMATLGMKEMGKFSCEGREKVLPSTAGGSAAPRQTTVWAAERHLADNLSHREEAERYRRLQEHYHREEATWAATAN